MEIQGVHDHQNRCSRSAEYAGDYQNMAFILFLLPSDNCVLLVLASEDYGESEHICDYNAFLKSVEHAE